MTNDTLAIMHKNKRCRMWWLEGVFDDGAGQYLPSLAIGIVLMLIIVWKNTSKQSDGSQSTAIPVAPGGRIPIVGHALQYKIASQDFLHRACKEVGPIFRINLAGKRMVVIAQDCPAMRQIVTSPESVVSSVAAVGEVGFLQALGDRNVHSGPKLVKEILKDTVLAEQAFRDEIPELLSVIDESLQSELLYAANKTSLDRDEAVTIPCFLNWMQRVSLRVWLVRMVGSAFQEKAGDDYITKFRIFQNHLEVAIVHAAALPRWIGLSFVLLPLQRRRLQLQELTSEIIKSIIEGSKDGKIDSSEIGYWLREMMKKYEAPEIAEYLVGLMFAAHKNPGIGSTQSFLFLRERATKDDQEVCEREATRFISDPSYETLQACVRTNRLCLETLRLTGHSLGAVRKVMKDINLEGTNYTVRKGETIAISHITANINSSAWGNDPTKLDTQSHDQSTYEDDYKFTTFSQGIHRCPGNRLAVVFMQETVSCLLANWDVQVEKSSPVCFERATLAQRAQPIQVTVRRKGRRANTRASF